jgi:hypothetical protein
MGCWESGEAISVLYIDGEMPAESVQERTRALAGENELDRLSVINHEMAFDHTGKVLSLADPRAQEALIGHCTGRGIELLVLDNLSCLFPGVGENDNDEWGKVLPWLLALRRAGIAVVIVHHAGRNGAMRGGSKREDAAAWIVSLDDSKDLPSEKEGAKFISRFTKNRHAPQDPPAIEWTFAPGANGKIDVQWKEASTLEVLRQWVADGMGSCEDLAREMNISKGQVSKLAAKGINAGWLRKDGREYALVEERSDGKRGAG